MKAVKKNTTKVSVADLKVKSTNVFDVKQMNGIIGGTMGGFGGGWSGGGIVGGEDFHW